METLVEQSHAIFYLSFSAKHIWFLLGMRSALQQKTAHATPVTKYN
jgi:hypothetical protein